MAVIRGLTAVLSADNRKLRRDLRRAQFQWRRYSRAVRNDMNKLGRAVGVASAAAGAAVGALGKNALNTADQIAKSARNAALSAESYQRLAIAFEFGGSSAQKLIKANQALQRGIYDYGRELSTQVDAFEDLGIAYEQIARLTPIEQFLLVRQRLSEVEDLTKRSALAQVVFSRAGKEMGTILTQNNREFLEAGNRLARFGGILSNNVTAAAEHLNDEMTLLGRVIRGNFAQGFIEGLRSVENADAAFLAAGRAARRFGQFIVQTAKVIAEFKTEILFALGILVAFKAALIAAGFIAGISNLIAAVGALIKVLKTFTLTVLATKGALLVIPILIGTLVAAIVAVGAAIYVEWERIYAGLGCVQR